MASSDLEGPQPSGIDFSTPSVARMYDYYLGGRNNFPVDREAAERVIVAAPIIKVAARANRGFLIRCVRYMAVEAGITQFIDLGAGMPTSPNVHEVARGVHPEASVVYVDNDPLVLSYSRALRATVPGVAVIGQDLTDPAAVFADPVVRELIDVGRPIGLAMLAVLHFIPQEESMRLVAEYRKMLPAGSCLALSTGCTTRPGSEQARAVEAVYTRTATPVVLRSRAEIEQLLEGTQLVEPGLVPVTQWRPDAGPVISPGSAGPPSMDDDALVGLVGAVGRIG